MTPLSCVTLVQPLSLHGKKSTHIVAHLLPLLLEMKSILTSGSHHWRVWEVASIMSPLSMITCAISLLIFYGLRVTPWRLIRLTLPGYTLNLASASNIFTQIVVVSTQETILQVICTYKGWCVILLQLTLHSTMALRKPQIAVSLSEYGLWSIKLNYPSFSGLRLHISLLGSRIVLQRRFLAL